jgi:hypothetical protein
MDAALTFLREAERLGNSEATELIKTIYSK